MLTNHDARLTAATLNTIAQEEETARDWRRVVTSASRHEFTLRHLLKRRWGGVTR